MAWVRHSIKLDQREPSGETTRQLLESIEEKTGKRPKELDQAGELNPACEWIWGAFQEMSLGRTYNMNGPAPLSNLDILAWCQLTSTHLLPWELRAVRAFDGEWMKGYNEMTKKLSGKPQDGPTDATPTL